MKKSLFIFFLLILFDAWAENWKRIPGSSDRLWQLRGEADASLAAVNLDDADIFSGDSFINLLEEACKEGQPLGIMQILYVLPSGEAASYYVATTWQDYVKSLETPMVHGYGLGVNPELIEELRREHQLSPGFIDELLQADPQRQFEMLAEKGVPAATINFLRPAFLKEYSLTLKDPATKQDIVAQREFFISRPDGHLWPTQELAQLENIFLTRLAERDFGGALLILDHMAELGERNIIGDFIDGLWMRIPEDVRQHREREREGKEEVVKEEVFSLKRIPGSSDEDWRGRSRRAVFDLKDVDSISAESFENLIKKGFCVVQVIPQNADAQYYSCESWDSYTKHPNSLNFDWSTHTLVRRDVNTRGSVDERNIVKFYINDARGHLWGTPELADQEELILTAMDQRNELVAKKILTELERIVERNPRYMVNVRELGEIVQRKFEAGPEEREIVLVPEVGPEERLEEIGLEDQIRKLMVEGNLDAARGMIAVLPDEGKQFEFMLALSAQEERLRRSIPSRGTPSLRGTVERPSLLWGPSLREEAGPEVVAEERGIPRHIVEQRAWLENEVRNLEVQEGRLTEQINRTPATRVERLRGQSGTAIHGLWTQREGLRRDLAEKRTILASLPR